VDIEEYCNALELIYRDYFRNFIDNDFQIMVCSQFIKQKCSGKYCERDLQGAERLNEHFLDFARKKESGELESDCSVEEFWGFYDEFGQLISNERMTSSSDKKSSESTFLKKVFPISYGAGTLVILLLKIAVYWLIELVGGIIGGIVPYLGMILSFSFSIYCWVGIILSIVQYVKNR